MTDAIDAAIARARDMARKTRRLSWFDAWGFTPQQVLIAHELMAISGARLEDLRAALDRVYPGRAARSDKDVSIRISQMRRRMAPHGARIEGDARQGWRFDAQTLRALLDEQGRAA